MELAVLIIGAGPAGLATAACLSQHSIPYLIVEREDCSASLWRNRTYDRLKLHLAKEFCALPYMPYPPNTPTYVPRAEFVKYLDRYIEHFDIQPRFCTAVESAAYDVPSKRWAVLARDTVSGAEVRYGATYLVVATGENGEGRIPAIPGQESFSGEAIHSTMYKSGRAHAGQRVLVVGSGNSGMEIAYDLASHGADTSIVIRSPVFKGVSKIAGNKVTFERTTKHMLNNDGFPKKGYPDHWKGEDGLYFAGFARRGLAGITMDAKNIASDIAYFADPVSV
ncbi:hypothetical protein PR202_gb23839 [Eleusine coracana subsp. coracana]|uniref:indole-3-pyruvate monooxygenase n=1 Tax=Eleusine coracana subsp. coracana TaxID=191504 RepID=A0AAV5FJX4_ELECO|nr:hypothetical protein PR202_gb23839 [Eleusine coracana subsp. coracana]